MTLQSLLDAGAAILREEDFAAFTVERIAGDCGVSVGTFYEYFPHKDAVLAELRRRHSTMIAEVLADGVAKASHLQRREAIRCVVAANVELHAADPKLHHALTVKYRDVGVDVTDKDATEVFLATPAHRFVDFLSEQPGLSREQALVAVKVVFIATESLTHAAIVDGTLELEKDALTNEIVRVVAGYLRSLTAESPAQEYATGWYRSVRLHAWQWAGVSRELLEAPLNRIRDASGERRFADKYDTIVAYGPGHWVYEFSLSADQVLQQGRAAAASGEPKAAFTATMQAAMLYTIASYPHLPDVRSREALRSAYAAYSEAGMLLQTPLQRWDLEVDGVTFPVFLHLPPGRAEQPSPCQFLCNNRVCLGAVW